MADHQVSVPDLLIEAGRPTEPWLVVLLRPDRALGFVASRPGNRFEAGGLLYREMPDGGFPFMDRLYLIEGGGFAGIDVTPIPERFELLSVLETLSYVSLNTQSGWITLSIFLTTERTDRVRCTVNQAMGFELFEAPGNEFAAAFACGFLAPGDIEAIKRSTSSWVSVRRSPLRPARGEC